MSKRFPSLPHGAEWLTNRPIAHRGLFNATDRPENSLAAFEAAAHNGDPIELDVQISADEELFVLHDENLERMTGQPGWIWNFSSDEIRQLHLIGSQEKIPTLQEVFDVVRGRVPILIEIKNLKNTRRIDELVYKAIQNYHGPIAIQSFNILSVAWFRRHAPEIPRGVLVADFKDVSTGGILRYLVAHLILHHSLIVWIARPHFVAYELEMLPCLAAHITHWNQKPVLCWVVRSALEKQAAQRYADNYIFERLHH